MKDGAFSAPIEGLTLHETGEFVLALHDPDGRLLCHSNPLLCLPSETEHVHFWGDLHGQPGVVERVYDNGFFAFGGWGSTNVGAGPVSTITSTFEGAIEYCVLPPGMSPIADARYACAAPHADTHAVCQARGHQLILRRNN